MDCGDHCLFVWIIGIDTMAGNTFYLMRHGHSQANAEGIICSNLSKGRLSYGLTTLGREQVRTTVEDMWIGGHWHQDCVIMASPFLRTIQTAEILAEVLGIEEIGQEERLRERFFGALDGGPDSQYQQVWDLDQDNPKHTQWQVESVTKVAQRGRDLTHELDDHYRDRIVILVAHGDICSILATTLSDQDLKRHRQLHPLATGACMRLGTR